MAFKNHFSIVLCIFAKKTRDMNLQQPLRRVVSPRVRVEVTERAAVGKGCLPGLVPSLLGR